jgi:hypothetical protein
MNIIRKKNHSWRSIIQRYLSALKKEQLLLDKQGIRGIKGIILNLKCYSNALHEFEADTKIKKNRYKL